MIQLLLVTALLAQETPLDKRRRVQLEKTDASYTIGAQDPDYPAPNHPTVPDGENYGQEKVLAIFGLVNLGLAPTSRLAEANRILRYGMLGRWYADQPGDLVSGNRDAWAFRGKNLGVRLYALYKGYLEPDIKAEFEKRWNWLCMEPFNNSSINIRATNNNARLLAHEFTGKTSLTSYANCKTWWINKMKELGQIGFDEWAGQEYAGWTIGAILNVAEFTQDATVRKYATMTLDHILALISGFRIEEGFCSGGNRWKTQWLFGDIPVQTFMTHVLFRGGTAGGEWTEFASSNYRPLSAVADLYANDAPLEAKMSQGGIRHRNYRGHDYSIATIQNPEATVGWHDVVSAYVKSAKDDASFCIPWGTPPTNSTAWDNNGWHCVNGRSFGYKNVAMMRLGGTAHKQMTSKYEYNVPLRLFHSKSFAVEFQNGWAFLTDGVTYIAWKPGVGTPVADPDSDTWTKPKFGFWLKSSFVPDEFGEAAVIEVGDADLFGSFQIFKADVLARNPNAVWSNNQMVYKAKDGAVLVLGLNFATVNGQTFDGSTWPRAKMPGLDNFTLTNAGITFNFNNGTVSGTQTRLPMNYVFGATGPAPLAITTGPLPGANLGLLYSTTLTASGGTPPYVTWVKIWGSFPPGLSLSGNTISGTPTTEGTWSFRVRVIDSAGAVKSKLFSITVGPPVPLAITTPATLPNGKKNVAYSTTLSASGGSGAYTNWVLIWGTMPPGLGLSGNKIFGTPAATGSWTFRIRVVDSAGAIKSRLFTLGVNP